MGRILEGFVFTKDGERVKGAIVETFGQKTTTDAKGHWALFIAAEGNHVIRITQTRNVLLGPRRYGPQSHIQVIATDPV